MRKRRTMIEMAGHRLYRAARRLARARGSVAIKKEKVRLGAAAVEFTRVADRTMTVLARLFAKKEVGSAGESGDGVNR